MKNIFKVFVWTIFFLVAVSAVLWDEKNNIYSSKSNYKVGDSVKIIFNENSIIQYKAAASSSKKLNVPGIKGSGAFVDVLPSVAGSDSFNTAYNAATKSKKVIKNKITAQIISILPNGNLKISGQHTVLINNQKESLSVSGIINPNDIYNKKYIYSSDIINPNIQYKNYVVANGGITQRDIVKTYSTNISVVSGVTQRNITAKYSLSDKKKQQFILEQLNKVLSILFSK